MNSITSSFRANIKNLVTHSASTGQKDFICFYQSETECVDQNIAVVTGIKINFSTNSRNAGAVSITGDAIDHTIEKETGSRILQFAKPQRVHQGNWACAHSKNISHYSTNASCSTLMRFNKRRVVVAFNFKCYS